ncbi:MAG: wax ester/triacylglycerol synthase family O-acyltransferase [Calditrichaeota bacterium]|nr:wax ester/triacylglycerol synthase family O-acyltransferase [Calditrichota bacterium]
MASTSQRMSNVDTAWLRMDDPTNLMMISGLILFKEPLEKADLRRVIENRLLKFDRFRQRIVGLDRLFGNPRWEDDPHLDLDYHIQEITLPAPGDATVLRHVVGQFMSQPLDFAHPLWQIHLIRNYQQGCAVLVRIHHCIADGIALVRVLLSLTDTQADASASTTPALQHPSRNNTGGGLTNGTSGWLQSLKMGAVKLYSLARLTLQKPDPRTLFKGKLGVAKIPAWSAPLPLDEVKQIGKTLGATVNDVLLSVVSGALRQYLLKRGEQIPPDLNIRAAVPFNLRPPEDAIRLGNEFGLLFLSLPLSIEDPVERLKEVKRRSLELKRSVQSQVVFGVLNLIGMVPRAIQKLVVNFFGTKITAVMTNVPGPQHPIYLAGKEVETILFWVPQSGRTGMGVSIFSYNHHVYIGLATDAGLVPEPAEIIQELHNEYDRLREATRAQEHLPPAETA